MLILAINPGSTSLKLSISEDDKELKRMTVEFDPAELEKCTTRELAQEYRFKTVMAFLESENYKPEDFDCVVSRGGVIGNVKAGAYRINKDMLQYIVDTPVRPHSIGVSIAYNLMEPLGRPAFIYDAVSADEWEPMYKLTGIKGKMKPTFQHTLNTRRVAFEMAKRLGKDFNEINVLVSHLGGGIDATFYKHGRIVESLGYNDLGFSPERCGALFFDEVVKLTKELTDEELYAMNHGKGGLKSLLGTTSVKEVEERIDAGDKEAEMVLECMAHRVAQTLACGAVDMKGDVDAIVLTGGIANSERFTNWIKERVEFIAPVYIIPGEMELEALTQGALRVMRGEEEAKEYVYIPKK